jgi:hypothetical protein
MIESNDGKINSSGLVSGLSRADFIGGSCARRARPRRRMDRPLNANYRRIRRATELGGQLMMSGIVDVSDCAFPLLYFLFTDFRLQQVSACDSSPLWVNGTEDQRRLS